METPENGANNPTDESVAELYTVGLKSLTAHGARLMLQPGDILIAVNGVPFAHEEKDLTPKVSTAGKGRCALTFLRDDDEFTLLTDTMDLGIWEKFPAVQTAQTKRISPGALNNWAIYRNGEGLYDIQCLAPSLFALVAAPFWLAQMRIWTPLATVCAVAIITLPFGNWIAATVYGICCIYVWRNANDLFKTDRIARGLEPYKIVAAPNEKSVHSMTQKFNAPMIYLFSKAATETTSEEDFSG